MSKYATQTETHNALKSHRCSWCSDRIDVGTVYRRYRFYDGVDAGTVKMHTECYDVMNVEAEEEGGWFEWSTVMERPKINDDAETI